MISLQIGFAILLEIITGQLWTAKMTTDWFGFSLEIQQWTAINMENNYTLSFFKVKTIGAQHQPPDKAYTLGLFFWDSWIDMFWKPLLLQIGLKKS